MTAGYFKDASSVSLPAIIPCNQCRVPKPQSQYSPKRLEDLQRAIITEKKNNRRFDPKSDGCIRCTSCIGGPAVEHECYHCEITFPRTDRYFSKAMLKNRKDEALCWSCSQREQNDTLSDSDGGSDNSSNCSDSTFVTNRFQDIDLESTTSETTSGFGTRDDSSGGVSLNGSNAASSGHTVYAGSSASMAGSARGTITSPSAGHTSTAAMGSSTVSASPSVASSRAPAAASASTRLPRGFNPNAYSSPRRRSPTSSVAGSTASKGSSNWAKVKPPPSRVAMDAVTEQHKDMDRREREHTAALAKQGGDMRVSDDDDDSD